MKIKNEQLIKKWEALKLKAYLPTPDDVWTIGWGHTHTTKPGMVITKAEAQALFEKDTAWVNKTLAEIIKVPVNQNQYDAIASWTFNVGATAARRSTLIRKLNAGDYEGAAREFPRWNKQKGKVLRGLTRRRAEEMEYFLQPVDSTSEPAVSSASVDEVEGLKPLLKSKEISAGVATAVLGGISALGDVAQIIGIVGLVVIGGFVVYNRVKARNDGQR